MRRQSMIGMIALGAITVLLTSFASAQQATDNADGGQALGIAQNPPMISTAGMQDYLKAVQLAHGAGVDGNAFTEKWSVLEPAPGSFRIDDFANGMNFFEDTYKDTVLLGIQVLNTNVKETPADLQKVAFDDPQMLQRFDALIDALLAKITHKPRYLSIGNEVDAYLDNHPQEWAAYKTFYDGAVAHVHQVAPEIQVGVTVTYSGLFNHTDEVQKLNEHSDVAIVTYYPLKANFIVEPADAPPTDFPKMIMLANGLPVVLQEVGYPSAALLNSSEADQAQFVTNVFVAWKSAGDQIPFLDFFLLHDLTDDFCSTLESYYGIKFPNFHAYLCTLGLRHVDGTPKQAWQAFVDEIMKWRSGS